MDRSSVACGAVEGAGVGRGRGVERHRIEGLLGRGGMGSVYRAYDTARERVVALKRLEISSAGSTREVSTQPDASASSAVVSAADLRKEARRRSHLVALFQREYATLAQLAHPRIIEVYDYQIDEQGPFYTMELLEGHDLSKVAPLPWRRTCEILRDVASALTLLHSRRLLHRDISPRNVHCSADGPAKLIDFGAMTPMGHCDVVLGTPAFVAPEVMQKQALDARTDLYALGALGYFLLTGANAYRARTFADLHDAYRSHPLPPSARVRDVPEALDALILQLLSLERGARPASAVELVERLNALASLEQDDRLAVASAYLATPALVGRQQELVAVRRRMLRASRGRGASVLVTGPAGVGRSRFLDACALEGKLVGALVLRGAPGASGGVDHGVVRSLLLQLHASLSEAERHEFEPNLSLQSQLLPGFTWTRGNSRPVSLRPAPLTEDPASIPRDLHEYFARFAERRPLVILVDDFQAIDEPSAAVIAGLAALTSRRHLALVTALTSHTPVNAEPALRLLRSHSRVLSLEPLEAQETETLLSTVFGAVPNLAPIAHRLHEVSGGKPRLCMELAQHLVDTGVVRYEAGGFVLPETLAASDLPESVEVALRQRFERLSPRAQELGIVVALCAGTPLTVAQCSSLVTHAEASASEPTPDDRVVTEQALTELMARQLVAIEGEDPGAGASSADRHITLRQGVLGSALLLGLPAERRRELHARIAELLAREPDLGIAAAEHYFHAGRAKEGLDLLLPTAESGRLIYETRPSFHALIDQALSACEQLGRPGRQSFFFRRARYYHQLHFMEACDTRELLAFADQLGRMCGLQHWEALSEVADPDARVMRALQLAVEDYQRLPEGERVYAADRAIAELARYAGALAGYGCATFDLELLERIPSLQPYVRLAPAIAISEAIVVGLRDMRATRFNPYVAGMERVLERLDQPDHAGLRARDHLMTRIGVLCAVAASDAALGRPKALPRADELDQVPSTRLNAWRVRQIAHLYRGDAQQADACRRRVELMLIQHGATQAHQGTTLETEFMCYACSDDLLNLRRLLPELETIASAHAGWVPLHLLARAELERMRGRLEAARELYERVLEIARPGRHMMWPYTAGFHVRVLVDLGRAEEAKALGLAALAVCAQHDMGVLGDHLSAAVACAEAALGQHQAACERLDRTIARVEDEGTSGMFAGIRYEDRARLALRMRDAATFEHCLERWRAHLGEAADSPFTARASKLLDEARRTGLGVDRAAELPPTFFVAGTVQRLRRELALCVDLPECGERALALLRELTGARAGHFYVLQRGKPVLLASTDGEPPAGLQRDLEAIIAGLDETDDCATELVESTFGVTSLTSGHCAIDAEDGAVYSVFEIVARDAKRVVAAVALAFAPAERQVPAGELIAAVGEELLSRADFTRITLTQ